jgi:hypothetical protein
MENDASGMVLDAGSVPPDAATTDGGSQAKCDRLLVNPVELDGSGGNVDEEGTQKFIAAEAPKGVVLVKRGANPVWSRSSSLPSYATKNAKPAMFVVDADRW